MSTRNDKALVSILLWSDNRAGTLAAGIDSLLRQTYANTEIIVIDNASTDGSVGILADFARCHPERIQLRLHDAPLVRTLAEAQVRDLPRGEFVAFASADSRSAPDRIAASVEQMVTTPNLGGICSRVRFETRTGQALTPPHAEAINDGEAILRRRIPREGNIVDVDTAMLRTALWRSQPFNPALTACGHLPLWLHVLDDAELLRNSDAWITKTCLDDAGMPATTTLAAARETVAAIATALRRWKLSQFFRFTTPENTPQRRSEESVAEAQLALLLVELDRRFFGRPSLGCHEAYFHALNANALEPRCLEAQQALQVVLRALGETPDSGGAPRLLADWRADPLAELPPASAGTTLPNVAAYRQWQRKHALHDIDGEYFAEHMVKHWQARPDFVVLELPGGTGAGTATATPAAQVASLADRLADQLYPPQAAMTAGDATTLADALRMQPLAGANAWLLLLPRGAEIAGEALIRLGDAIALQPAARAWYADDELLAAGSGAVTPRFKPDTDPLLLAGSNYLGALAIRLDCALAQGDTPLDAATAYALALAVLASDGRSALGHLDECLFSLPPPTPAQAGAELQALRRHLDRDFAHDRGRHGAATAASDGPTPNTRWLRRQLTGDDTPSVSIIVVADEGQPAGAGDIAALRQRTPYAKREWLHCGCGMPAGAGDARTVAPLAGESLPEAINRAAQQATGDYLLIIGAASRPLQDDWLETALALAVDGNYAAVGIAGVDPGSGRLWGSGTVVGIGGGFDSLHGSSVRYGEPGHLDRAAVAHECSAVSADGLLTRRADFIKVGGFDPQCLQASVIATDYCLRLRECGERIAWTPQAVIARATPDIPESTPVVERLLAVRDRFISRWLPRLAADPYWNRHLSLTTPEPTPEADLVFRWHPAFRDRLRVLALPMPASGQAEYRVTAPLRALDAAGLAQTMLACEPLPGRERAPIPSELARLAPDTIYLQAAFDDVRFAGLRACARFNPGIFRIFSLDDRVSDMPAYNASSKALPRDLVTRRMTEALRCCNRLVVSTEPLAELYRHEIDDIAVVPNRLEKARWLGLPQAPANRANPGKPGRPRVGWAGALQHAGDLAMIREVVETLAKEVDWVFFGMIPAGCEPFIKEFHAAVHLDDYPSRLASLALDLAVAPLEVNLFNEAKSNLRLIEYGVFGWPVICTDIEPFRSNDAPVCRLPNDARRWIAAIREHLADRNALKQRGRELQAWVHRHYLLEDHLDQWLRALTPG